VSEDSWFFIVKKPGQAPRVGLPVGKDFLASVREWHTGNPEAEVTVVRIYGGRVSSGMVTADLSSEVLWGDGIKLSGISFTQAATSGKYWVGTLKERKLNRKYAGTLREHPEGCTCELTRSDLEGFDRRVALITRSRRSDAVRQAKRIVDR
jgi:hypothetical protein